LAAGYGWRGRSGQKLEGSVTGAAGRIIGGPAVNGSHVNSDPVNGQVGQRERQWRHGGIHQMDHGLQHGLKNGDRFSEGRSDGLKKVTRGHIDTCSNRDGHRRDGAGRNHTVHHRHCSYQVVGSACHTSHDGLQKSRSRRSSRRSVKGGSNTTDQRCRQ
jgi:hypothetical protein